MSAFLWGKAPVCPADMPAVARAEILEELLKKEERKKGNLEKSDSYGTFALTFFPIPNIIKNIGARGGPFAAIVCIGGQADEAH